jgi:ComF family protein
MVDGRHRLRFQGLPKVLEARALALRLAQTLLDFALPPRCPGCGTITEEPHLFCFECWSGLDFLGPPCCARCAHPFEYDAGEAALCGACSAAPPDYDQLRAAVVYGEISRKVALRLKYGGRPGHAETLARLMQRHLVRPGETILAPVPLHRWRIWKRGYNQAALIAGALARRTGAQIRLDLLERIKSTPPLKGRNPRQRREALAGAFRLSDRYKEEVRGRSLILVDDVYTSGATANACARILKRAGAARVDVLCWARVVRSDEH